MRAVPSGDTREAVRAAAQWLALIESGDACDDDYTRLQSWRDSHGAHEAAWQKAQLLRQRFFGLPSTLAMAALDRPDLDRRVLIKRTLGVVVVVPTAWLVCRQLPLDVWRADVHTGIGERRKVHLADGSSLQLNTDSAVNINLGQRRLTLVRGEAALKVPGGAPLALQGGYGLLIVDRGEVCMSINERECRVSVVSGAAQLQPLRGPPLELHEGQQVSLHARGVGAVLRFDPLLPGWREGVLTAQNQPLGDFLRELGRYRPGLLRWEPALESLRVTGSFRLDNTDRVLSLLAASLPIEVQLRTRYWVTLVPRKKIA